MTRGYHRDAGYRSCTQRRRRLHCRETGGGVRRRVCEDRSMGDLATDTTVEQTDASTFTCDLSPDWEIWGPNGGYLAAVALRAAGHGQRTRPPGVDQRTLRRRRAQRTGRHRRRGESAHQGRHLGHRPDHPGGPATARRHGVGCRRRPRRVGASHRRSARTTCPTPRTSQSTEELLGVQEDGPPRHPFWGNIEQRPTEWIDDWENREASEPSTRAWVKFVPDGDVCRSMGRRLPVADSDRPRLVAVGHAEPTSATSNTSPRPSK